MNKFDQLMEEKHADKESSGYPKVIASNAKYRLVQTSEESCELESIRTDAMGGCAWEPVAKMSTLYRENDVARYFRSVGDHTVLHKERGVKKDDVIMVLMGFLIRTGEGVEDGE